MDPTLADGENPLCCQTHLPIDRFDIVVGP